MIHERGHQPTQPLPIPPGSRQLKLFGELPLSLHRNRSEGRCPNGIFDPWVRWDRGLDPARNSSAVAAVAVRGPRPKWAQVQMVPGPKWGQAQWALGPKWAQAQWAPGPNLIKNHKVDIGVRSGSYFFRLSGTSWSQLTKCSISRPSWAPTVLPF